MKNTLLLGTVLLSIASLFTACSDDNGSNPTLIQPTELTLNTPAYANQDVDLKNTESIQLSWSQPKYTADNAPINATYEVQLSLTNSFTVSKEEADADESKSLTADYITLDKTYTTCIAEVLSSDIDKALNQIGSWTTEAKVPKNTNVYVRLRSYVLEGSTELNSVVSNVVDLSMIPYYVELKDADPIMWYLVGNNILDGSWSDKPGISSMPMFVIPGGTYDKTTGAGEIEYINYFTTDGWKIQPESFDWNYGFMNGGSANTAIYRNGEGDKGDIKCDPAGLYKVTVNTKDNTCTIAKQDDATVYKQMCVAGTFTGDNWPDANMTPVNKSGENHVWIYTVTVSDNAQFKFKTPGDWTTNWGYGSSDGEVNTMGKCTAGGKNIGLAAGKWLIMFNDINGWFNIRAVK